MSTLRVDNIGRRSGDTQDTLEGQAKAWANWNGTGAAALRDSFNVSGLTDQGTGSFSFAFTNALTNSNFNSVASGGQGVPNTIRDICVSRVDQIATGVRMETVRGSNNSSTDFLIGNFSVMGDLA